MVSPVTHHLVGVHELARRWGVTRQRVHALRDEGKIPEGTRLKGAIVWELSEIERYEAKSGREVVDPGPYADPGED